MRRNFLTGGGLALALVLLFAVNMLTETTLGTARIDLTEHRLFTLSKGTRSILAGLEEPITLRLYLSQGVATRMPGVNSYASRVKELLTEYARSADGKVSLHIIDPEPFSEEEDRAVGYGLRGLPVGNEGGVLYLGLVGSDSTDRDEVIPFLSPEREQSLEYDVTRLIYKLAHPEQKVVGLLSTLPIDGLGPRAALRGLSQPAWVVHEQMTQLFDVRSLSPQITEIPDDTDVLMLVHPKGLPDAALYAIDQFVLRGGRALVFVDANADAEQPTGGMVLPGASRRSEIDPLLEAWGVRLEPDTVVGDLELAVTVRMDAGGRALTFDYPVWMNLQPSEFNHEDVITGDLGNISVGTAGSLVPVDGATTTVTPLIRTTEGAAAFPAGKVGYNQDPESLLRDYKPAGRAFTLAARVTGPVRSAFPDGPPKAPEPAGEAKAPEPPRHPHLGASQSDVNLIVVADTDLLHDRFWVQVQEMFGSRLAIPSAANGALVINALDNLTGSNDLISVRNRGSFARPFERFDALRQSAELKYRAKEQELIARLQATEQKLLELERTKQGDEGLILSADQQAALVEFRQEKLRIRKELRSVRRQLREDIERLQAWLKFMNVGLVPLVVGAGGLVVAGWRMRRRRLSLAQARAA